MGCKALQIQDFFEVQDFEPRKNIQRRMPHIQSSTGSLNYCVNKIGVFENTLNLFADATMRSRKGKADYIFRIMTQAMSDNVGNVFWGFGANFYFAGSGRFDFRKNDGFVNALREDSLQRRYLMTPFSKLEPRPTEFNYNRLHEMDSTWNEWKVKNIVFWNRVSNITDQTGL